MTHKPILCMDFDGVIHSYKSGWQGADRIPDPPVEGVFDWMLEASELFDIHIYSSRSIEPEGRAAMEAWMKENCNVPILHLLTYSAEKPRAMLTIDDRCIRFDGNWSDPRFNPATLREFQSWYQLLL